MGIIALYFQIHYYEPRRVFDDLVRKEFPNAELVAAKRRSEDDLIVFDLPNVINDEEDLSGMSGRGVSVRMWDSDNKENFRRLFDLSNPDDELLVVTIHSTGGAGVGVAVRGSRRVYLQVFTGF